MIRFIEVVSPTGFHSQMERSGDPNFTLAEVWINEDYVVSIREAPAYKSLLKEGRLPSDLEGPHSFTRVTTHNGHVSETYVVVGSPAVVAGRLSHDKKTLLKG